MNLRILSGADVERAVSVDAAVEAMRTAFAELARGHAVVPMRGTLDSTVGTTLLMPAFLAASGGLGAKIVSVFPGNAGRGEPPVQGAVLLLDSTTGAPRALLDGTRLTELRTAAASALATELLADSEADVLTVFGAGAQGRAHIQVLSATRRLREIRIVSPLGSAETLAAELGERAGSLRPAGTSGTPPTVRPLGDPAEALEGAGIVVTATTSSTPVFDSADLSPGAHVNAVGSFRPNMQEVDAELVMHARVVADQRSAVWEEAGDLIIPLWAGLIDENAVHAELGEIVIGDAPSGRQGFDFTLFESVGNAAQDIAIAQTALAGAIELGLGQEVDFS